MFYKTRDFIRRHFIGYRPSDMPCLDYLEYLESKGEGTMKIIDLLNRIAKDEGIPIKIKFKDKTWEWNSEFYDYRCEEDNHRYLVEELETEDLNKTCEEITIIEDKKIEPIWNRSGENYDKKLKDIYEKINEIIDYINKEE